MLDLDLSSKKGTLRQRAFAKLGQLAVKPQVQSSRDDDFIGLCDIYGRTKPYDGRSGSVEQPLRNTGKGLMTTRELEVLLALCATASAIQNPSHAERLVTEIGPYLIGIHNQAFKTTPFLRTFRPSPWELVAHKTTSALLAVAKNHNKLKDTVFHHINLALEKWTANGKAIADQSTTKDNSEYGQIGSNTEQSINGGTIRLCASLLGFVSGITEMAFDLTLTERFTILQSLHVIMSNDFMAQIETNLSVIRGSNVEQLESRIWQRVLITYASSERPLGALLLQHSYLKLTASLTAPFALSLKPTGATETLDVLVASNPQQAIKADPSADVNIQTFAQYIIQAMDLLNADTHFLHIGSAWQQRLAFSAKAFGLKAYLYIFSAFREVVSITKLMSWLEGITSDPVQLADDALGQTALKCMVVLARHSPKCAGDSSRLLPQLLVQGKMTNETAMVAADSLAHVLQLLPQDMQISTLYSLGNVLSSGVEPTRIGQRHTFDGTADGFPPDSLRPHWEPNHSSLSFVSSDVDETDSVYGIAIQAVVKIAIRCKDEKIVSLVLAMLLQKLGRASMAMDVKIIEGSAVLGLISSINDLKPLLKIYCKLCQDSVRMEDKELLKAVMAARLTLARGISKSSSLYEVYLTHLLETIVSTTGLFQGEKLPVSGRDFGAEEIEETLRPLAVLASVEPDVQAKFSDPAFVSDLTRDAWFNLVAHNFTIGSSLAQWCAVELEALALHSPSIVDEKRAIARESGIELNTVLKRNLDPDHTTAQRQQLSASFPGREIHMVLFDYAELTFLNAAHLIAVLRARAGTCTRTIEYFCDPKFKSGALSDCLIAIAVAEVRTYLAITKTNRSEKHSAPMLAQQLISMLQACCHRNAKVRQVATLCADMVVDQFPSVLCNKTSLYAMLELLTLMWKSCLDEETQDAEWQSEYVSIKGNVTIQLSDDFEARKSTLVTLLTNCRRWVTSVVDSMPLDIKGLLQTYLSEFDDIGAYGHVALGRSFAVEMACLTPKNDLRIGNMDRKLDIGINSASDFIAQYTTRQGYRTIDNILDTEDVEGACIHFDIKPISQPDVEFEVREALRILCEIEVQIGSGQIIQMSHLKPALQKASALVCRADVDCRTLVHLIVYIPCSIYTKESIKLGISLWSGIMSENGILESQILAEVMLCWERIFRQGRGIFGRALAYPDPFFVKQEFAPSDKDAVAHKQQQATDAIIPAVRMLQFLSSQFHSNQYNSAVMHHLFLSIVMVSYDAIKEAPAQPLSRELYFRIVIAGLRGLASAKNLDEEQRWLLKDMALSTGLKWFARPSRWSFGGNKLQIKADIKLMNNVLIVLEDTANIAITLDETRNSLRSKAELFIIMIHSEIERLITWLDPLNNGEYSFVKNNHAASRSIEHIITNLLPVAWKESPSLAIQLSFRFRSDRLIQTVQQLLFKNPEKALNDVDAVSILLGVAGQVPNNDQLRLKDAVTTTSDMALVNDDLFLRYLIYWAPTDPITAVNYLLPIYGNHPFVIQYAVRALDSHAVDITFFYVPQIVQALRADVLGYVTRYIVETAKFSQLFAHQIIWNMKANAYKDEDSQVPDDIKPILDEVMAALIDSFTPEDKDFYEREFTFFNQVTNISGTLRPFIKRPKTEKKQKIEEELRKIKVDVGVYLPSNPEGVVVGIDRQSGKPLQSHAKAPFMATFRIRKERMDEINEQISHHAGPSKTLAVTGPTNLHRATSSVSSSALQNSSTHYELWQSAIFKVGDDCRQDVLALQLVSVFRSIFASIGLDVYVFPYRVTATAPGCGVIDVLPNSISRDMLGREQVNGLYEWFVSHFGTEDSLAFQQARANFVKSMAAYSVISYLLRFKDRHNGNIMIDDKGHVLHIDFGFLFDIAPGGVGFERSPFKLTPEMVSVLGPTLTSPSYLRFESLCVKAFLASRPYAHRLCSLIAPMLESGLPCFKPNTVKNFLSRFVLERDERGAAEYMRGLVRKSEKSISTRGYDEFQWLTNGIPY